jgi:hypothetical protein
MLGGLAIRRCGLPLPQTLASAVKLVRMIASGGGLARGRMFPECFTRTRRAVAQAPHQHPTTPG